MNYFMGIDTAQNNEGVSIIDSNNKIIVCEDTGKREEAKNISGKDIPDILKNAYQAQIIGEYLDKYNIKMVLLEGPNYSGSNVQQISIGSIHGVMQYEVYRRHLNMAILTPKGINYCIFGTAKEISKKMTMDEMKQRFPDHPSRMNSNMGDSLAMAYLAKKLYNLLIEGCSLSKGEKEIFMSRSKYKGRPKGLVYNLNNKLFLFDSVNNKYFEGESALNLKG